jgi:hypothetical protein
VPVPCFFRDTAYYSSKRGCWILKDASSFQMVQQVNCTSVVWPFLKVNLKQQGWGLCLPELLCLSSHEDDVVMDWPLADESTLAGANKLVKSWSAKKCTRLIGRKSRGGVLGSKIMVAKLSKCRLFELAHYRARMVHMISAEIIGRHFLKKMAEKSSVQRRWESHLPLNYVNNITLTTKSRCIWK